MASSTAQTAGSETLTLPTLPWNTEGRGGDGIQGASERNQRLANKPNVLSTSRNPYWGRLVGWDAPWLELARMALRHRKVGGAG